MIQQIKNSPLLCWLVPLASALVTGTGFAYFLDFSTTNVFSVIFLILLYPVYQKALQQKHDKTVVIASVCCGILFTFFFMAEKTGILLPFRRPRTQ